MRVPTNVFFQTKMSLITSHYENLSKLLTQQSTGKKLLAASDDPVLASRIQMIDESIEDINSYQQNGVVAKSRSKLFQSSIDGVVNTTEQVKQILLRAATDTVSDQERAAMAATLKSYLTHIQNASNAKDTNGDFIYAGYNASSQPYLNQNGNYTYQGTLNATLINIGQYSSAIYAESGYDVFGNISTGNGIFTVTGSSSNTGTALTTIGSVTNQGAYVSDTYTIAFVTNGAGKLGYTVTGASSGQVIPPLPATIPANAPDYISGSDIMFNGMSINMSGVPNIGDTFQVQPSQTQNIFNTLQSAITLLETPIGSNNVSRAAYHQSLNQIRGTIDQSYTHFVQYQQEFGNRTRMIDTQVDLNEKWLLEQREMKVQLSDPNSIDIISEISRETTYLQATMDSYRLIEKTLLEILRI